MRPLTDETLAYHAARLLVLIKQAGSPQTNPKKRPAIRGRTLLAKFDFFVRYPVYLVRAARILRLDLGLAVSKPEANSVESRMVRYLYGPWDDVYPSVLAYLVGKGFIQVDLVRGVEEFRLTFAGIDVANSLAATDEYSATAIRAKALTVLFKGKGGTAVKEFIYRHFPDVVSRQLGSSI